MTLKPQPWWYAFLIGAAICVLLNAAILGTQATAPIVKDKFSHADVPDWLFTAEAALNFPAIFLGSGADNMIAVVASGTLFWSVFSAAVTKVVTGVGRVNPPAPNPGARPESD